MLVGYGILENKLIHITRMSGKVKNKMNDFVGDVH